MESINIKISSAGEKVKSFNTSEGNSAKKVWIIGDLIGKLDKDGHIIEGNPEKLLLKSINKLLDKQSSDLTDYVGNFSVVTYNLHKKSLYIICSTTGRSPYIYRDANDINLIYNENKLMQNELQNLSIEKFVELSHTHQLVIREPFNLISRPDIFRAPAGCWTTYKYDEHRCDHESLIQKRNGQINNNRLKISLISIIKLYQRYYQNNVGLYFSGGLDSSCLAGLMYSEKISMPFVHCDYKGKYSARSLVAAKIAEKLNFRCSHIPRIPVSTSLDEILYTLDNQFMTMPNSMYIGNPVSSFQNQIPKYMITGQGADSIYAIDTFAPPTEMIGIDRVNHIMKTNKLRLAFCNENILAMMSENKSKNSLSEILSSKKYYDLVYTQCTSLDEHVSYINSKCHTQLTETHRGQHIAKRILAFISSQYSKSTISLPIEIYRHIKWLRSLINVPNGYANGASNQNFKLTPFLEGPIVQMCFGHRLDAIEALCIKDKLEKLFTQFTGLSHRELVEEIMVENPRYKYDFGEKLGDEMEKEKVAELTMNISNYLHKRLKTHQHFSASIADFKNVNQLMRTAIFTVKR